jgi:hypothetical protein
MTFSLSIKRGKDQHPQSIEIIVEDTMFKMTLYTIVSVAFLFVACSSAEKMAESATATADKDGWKSFKADSGYEGRYPLEFYSLRNSPSPSSVLFPGIKTLIPSDSFYYAEPRAVTYRISIAVSDNGQHFKADDSKMLLAHSAIKPYDPNALAYHSVQEVMLGGVKAYRVDGLQIDPTTTICIQIVTLHNDRIYELLVDPQQLADNSAEPFATGTVTPENKELIEKIIATFKFSY